MKPAPLDPDRLAEPPMAAGTMLSRKLGHHASFSAGDRAALNLLLERNVRRVAGRTVLVEQGAAPSEIHVIIDGWACRYATLPDGRRRIVAFYLPGDVCDFDIFLMTAMDQSIAAITTTRVSGINRQMLNELSHHQPRISQGLWWESLMAAAIQRAWTINIGHRAARSRLAHLLCELYARLSLVGLAADGMCALPLTQFHLADACAMTAVHANRALQEIRRDGVLSLEDGRMTIHDWDQLAAIARFDPGYLQVPGLRPSPARGEAIEASAYSAHIDSPREIAPA